MVATERERTATAHTAPLFTEDADLDYLRLHVQALQRVLIRKGLVTYAEVLEEVHHLEETDHRLGAKVVARAWTDANFKQRLLQDAKSACAELGIEISPLQQQSPEALRAFQKAEADRWWPIIKASNIKVE